MEQHHYAHTTYIEDLESLIFHHQHAVVRSLAEKGVLEDKVKVFKAKCDSLVKDIKDIDKTENSDETLKKTRKDLSEQLMSNMAKLKYFRDNLTRCESELEKFQLELGKMYMQRLHCQVVHGI